jgi:hypothetical protein
MDAQRTHKGELGRRPEPPATLCRLQGCQMVYFPTKIHIFDWILEVLQWQMLLHFINIWCSLWSFGIFCFYLVCFIFIWYIFSRFGKLNICQPFAISPGGVPPWRLEVWTGLPDFFKTVNYIIPNDHKNVRR